MSRNGKSFLKPGGLVQKMTKYEKDRKKTIQKNKIIFDALGIKSLKNSMFGSIEKDNSESCRVGKRKVGETDNDEDYQPLDDEGLSSSSDNGEPFDSQVIEDIHMGPGKKTNRCAARLIASQTPREKRSTVDEDTLTLPRRPVAAQVNHSESTPEVSTQPIHLPALHTRPDQLPTSATQPDHLSSPCTVTNSGASIPERGDRIPVTLNRLTRAIEGDYATPLAAALGQQIRQTFDFGDYNNDVDVRCIIDHKCQTLYSEWKSRLHTHYKSLKKDNVSDLKSQILYPCTKDDWEWMIDNLWETDDWKVRECDENERLCESIIIRAARDHLHRMHLSFKLTITKLFEDTHRRHRYGGVWINNTAEEHHATMVSKIAEQSQPSVTHPLSEEQISGEVLGKRSVYLKGYGIRKDSTSSATHFEAPNSEVIVLQQQLVDQRQQLVDQGKQLLDQAQNMSTMQTIIQMLAAKNGIDLANIPGLVPSNNVGEDASGVREDETSLYMKRDVQEIFKMTPHDKQMKKMRAQQSKFLATINSIINDGLDGSEGGEEACPSDIRSDTGEPTQDATANGGIDHWLVEHPVTEQIAEINLPAAQVAVGMGIPLWQIPARTDAFPAGLRVLVVDNDLVWLRILEKMLKKCSYEGKYTLDGNSHVIYAEEEAAGTRLLIDGRTCLLQNDHDPPKLVAETPCKLLRYLVLDGSHVEADIPFVEVEVMKMCMPLLSPASGIIHFLMSEGQAMQAGELIARLDLDDPSAVRKAEPFHGSFPILGPPTAISEKHNIDEVVQNLLSCLDNPELPFLQWQECLSVLATRLPKDLRYELESKYKMYEGSASFQNVDFPAKVLRRVLEAHLNSCPANEKGAQERLVEPLMSLVKSYEGGRESHTRVIVQALFEEYLSFLYDHFVKLIKYLLRGMMYYRKALELQAFLYMAKDEDLMEGYKAVELNMEDQIKGERSLWAQCQAVADMKFTYVVSCQQYGIDKRSGNPRAQDILRLMTTYVFRYPSLHVAYIDEDEEPSKDASKKINQKVYYFELVKAALPKSANSSEAVQNLDQVCCCCRCAAAKFCWAAAAAMLL
ncbi:unnamed protein product [Camellia sinensis]